MQKTEEMQCGRVSECSGEGDTPACRQDRCCYAEGEHWAVCGFSVVLQVTSHLGINCGSVLFSVFWLADGLNQGQLYPLHPSSVL